MFSRPRLILAAMAVLSTLGFASQSWALDVTIDLNGFPNKTGGQMTWHGMIEPVKFPPNQQHIVLRDLKPGISYSVDFFHNSGERGSDFIFQLNEKGTGVGSINAVPPKVEVLKDFKPGDTTLTLRTFPITYNANSGQKGAFFIHGVTDQLRAGAGPQKFMAVPGFYTVDNLSNHHGGKEDFSFFVDSQGKVSPTPEQEEYIEVINNEVHIRATNVHFKVEASNPINIHTSHKLHGPLVRENNVYEFDILVPVGGAGVNVWTFGQNKVEASNSLRPDGTKLVGFETTNDFQFAPRLRYTEKDGFFFDTTDGKSKSVWAEAMGMSDDTTTNLQVKVTATVKDAKPLPADFVQE